MFNATEICIAGNLVEVPEGKTLDDGTITVRFRIASTPRVYNRETGTWADAESLFLTVTAWRRLAEHVIDSGFGRGTPLIVHGRLRQRTYDTKDGERRTAVVEADHIGPDLIKAPARHQTA